MPLYTPALPPLGNPAVGQYMFTASSGVAGTSATQGVGTLRLSPWRVQSALSIDRIGAEITSAGDAASLLRIGIYADTGNCYPGALVLDAGTIAGDSATVQNCANVSLTLAPGLYWVGGAVQNTSGQPTVRITATWTPPASISLGSSIPSANVSAAGYSQTSVTGALPATFSATVTTHGGGARVHVRVA
jgi:hypothetical protein